MKEPATLVQPAHLFGRTRVSLPAAFYRVPFLLYRGLHSTAVPENSFAAFDAAVGDNYAGIALDVRSTSDGELVVFSDAALRRLTGDNRSLSDLRYRDLLGLRLQGTGEQVPLLEDVLERYMGVPLCLDLKHPGLEAGVTRLLSLFPFAAECVVLNTWWDGGFSILQEKAPRIAHSRGLRPANDQAWLREVIEESREAPPPIGARNDCLLLSLHAEYFSRADIAGLGRKGAQILLWGSSAEKAERLRGERNIVHILDGLPISQSIYGRGHLYN